MTTLRIAALLEVTSLAVLLLNLLSLHAAGVATVVGPLHGSAYLVVIGSTLLLPVRVGVRARAVLPGIGGLLALRAAHAALGARPSLGEVRP